LDFFRCEELPLIGTGEKSDTLIEPPNGLELSGPAKTPSQFRAELAGSAPASG
jgi:hypothetical protein